MEDVKNANGYPVNKAVEELMNVVTRGGEPVFIKIHSILPIDASGYYASNFSINLKGTDVMCSAIDIGNINPSGEYRLYMYTGKPNATYDNYGYDGLISRRYMYAIIDASMDRGSLSFWFVVLANSISGFEKIAYK